MRRWHELPASGYGRLDANGIGRHTSWGSWLLDLPGTADPAISDVYRRARRALNDFAATPAPEPRLLHGDLVARHVLFTSDRISGIIDLDSARAGDPLTEVAGWTLREDPTLTNALATSYLSAGPTSGVLTAITVYRVRIGLSMHAFHYHRGDSAFARSLLTCVATDLADLTSGTPRLVPSARPTLDDPLDGGTSWLSSASPSDNASVKRTARFDATQPRQACS
jgi:aminoglycoside phosphotransferase (APT) family kinase protein